MARTLPRIRQGIVTGSAPSSTPASSPAGACPPAAPASPGPACPAYGLQQVGDPDPRGRAAPVDDNCLSGAASSAMRPRTSPRPAAAATRPRSALCPLIASTQPRSNQTAGGRDPPGAARTTTGAERASLAAATGTGPPLRPLPPGPPAAAARPPAPGPSPAPPGRTGGPAGIRTRTAHSPGRPASGSLNTSNPQPSLSRQAAAVQPKVNLTSSSPSRRRGLTVNYRKPAIALLNQEIRNVPPGPHPNSGNQPEGLGINRPRTRLTVSEQEKRQLQPRFIGNMPASHRRPVRARVMPLALTRPERPPRARSPEQGRRHQAHGNIFPGLPAAHLRHRRAKIIYLNRRQPGIPVNQAHTGTMSPELARVTETRRGKLNAERNVTIRTTGRPPAPSTSCAGHRQSLHLRNVQLEIQRKTSLGIGQVHREPTARSPAGSPR